MVNDPVADFINRLKNAQAVGHARVQVPYSKLKEAVAQKLVACGFLKEVRKKQRKKFPVLEVTLAYLPDGSPKITDAVRVSKPGRRLYAPAAEMPRVRQGKGVLVVSTSKGILSDTEARKENVGGELLFKIW